MTPSFITISPLHFNKLREVKRLIKDEFGHTLHLQDSDFKNTLYTYAYSSRNPRLKALYHSLSDDFLWGAQTQKRTA